MFNRKKTETRIDLAIDALLSQMEDYTGDTEEFAAMTDQLVKLYGLKKVEDPKKIDPNTLLTVGANLTGILFIVGHERANVITSKAVQFVLRAR